MKAEFESWGRTVGCEAEAEPIFWRNESFPDLLDGRTCLPYGLGRSYGDSCLNPGGFMLETAGLDRLIAFDDEAGILRCEAGASLDSILKVIVPRGWFLPVCPGTKNVTIGGAIANDVHGKNHHVAGTFGCHVTRFELLRSDDQRLVCSAKENPAYFGATIGGLGLTGLITWAEVRLKRIETAFLDVETIEFGDLGEFFKLCEEEKNYEYTVAWVDGMARGKLVGRGIYFRANHCPSGSGKGLTLHSTGSLPVPTILPGWLLNRLSARVLNGLYFHRQRLRGKARRVHYDPFFFPLDRISHWNRLYGKRGFHQYQFVLPESRGEEGTLEVLDCLARSGLPFPLAILKKFGSVESPGLLSFPRPGFTFAVDFPMLGEKTKRLHRQLDELVMKHGGRLYPAKDARMPAEMFSNSYSAIEEFEAFIDPRFSSGFWRRVTTRKDGDDAK